MSEFEHLGDRLREQLHALVEDVSPSEKLLTAVDALAAGRRSRLIGALQRLSPRRIALLVSVPGAAAAAAIVLLFSSGPAPSVAGVVTVLPNGDVRVLISQIIGVTSANAELRQHHITNMRVVPMTATCPYQNWTYLRGAISPAPLTTLTPRTIPRGFTVELAAKQVGRNDLVSAIGRFEGKLPTCASSRGHGEGMGVNSGQG